MEISLDAIVAGRTPGLDFELDAEALLDAAIARGFTDIRLKWLDGSVFSLPVEDDAMFLAIAAEEAAGLGEGRNIGRSWRTVPWSSRQEWLEIGARWSLPFPPGETVDLAGETR